MTTRAANTPFARLALLGALAVLGIASAAGCRNDRASAKFHGDRFPADGAVRPVDRFIHVQSAAAARTDATLNHHHFDAAGTLNSLGRRKLDLMLHDDAAAPLVVWLDLSRANASARAAGVESVPPDACTESVRVFLADRGVDDSLVDLRAGPNAADTHPARDGLRGLKALQSEQSNGAAAAGPGGQNRTASGVEMLKPRS